MLLPVPVKKVAQNVERLELLSQTTLKNPVIVFVFFCLCECHLCVLILSPREDILINAAPISLYTEAVARGISLNLMGIVVLN